MAALVNRQDDRATWQLIDQLAGLKEDFTVSEFLDRPALRELLVMDRAAIKPLEQALTKSSDWSIRAGAAYLLTQLQDTSVLYASFKLESNLTVKAILFRGASARTAYTDVMEKEIAGLDPNRLVELKSLSERPSPLSVAQIQERVRRVIPLLESGNSNSDGLRAVRILGEIPPSGFSTILEQFESLQSESGRMKAMEAIRANLSTFDPLIPEHGRTFTQSLESLLGLIERTSVDVSALVRGRTMELALAIALKLDALGMDPKRPVQVLQKLSQDKDPSYSSVADELLKNWEIHLIEVQKTKERQLKSEGGSPIPPSGSPFNPPMSMPPGSSSADSRGMPPTQDQERGPFGRGRVLLVLALVLVCATAVWGVSRLTRRS